ncbi:hypothetical protein AYI70_g10393, partial [Smittium culicis]
SAVSETPNLFGNFIDSPVSPGQQFSTNTSSRFDGESDDGEFSANSDAGSNSDRNINKLFTSSETFLQRPADSGSFGEHKRETAYAYPQTRALRSERDSSCAADTYDPQTMLAEGGDSGGRPKPGAEARTSVRGTDLDSAGRGTSVSSRTSGSYPIGGRGVAGHDARSAIAAGNSDAYTKQQDNDAESVYSEVSATFITQEM